MTSSYYRYLRASRLRFEREILTLIEQDSIHCGLRALLDRFSEEQDALWLRGWLGEIREREIELHIMVEPS